MFKNGKIFGKINIIDFSIVFLIILLILAAYIKFGVLDNTKTDSKMNEIEYAITIENIKIYTVNAYNVGDTVFDSQTSTNIGVIKEIVSSPHKENVTKLNGDRVYSETPDKYDVTLIVDVQGIENDTGYFANKNIELKVGSEKKIETLYAKSTGKITGIICEKGE